MQEAGRVRRRCQLCFKEEPRACDRMLYSVCYAEPDYVDGKGWFLHSWGPLESTFSRETAAKKLEERVAREASAERYRHIEGPFPTKSMTIEGRAGTLVSTNGGGVFYFIHEQLVDVSDVLRQEG